MCVCVHAHTCLRMYECMHACVWVGKWERSGGGGGGWMILHLAIHILVGWLLLLTTLGYVWFLGCLMSKQASKLYLMSGSGLKSLYPATTRYIFRSNLLSHPVTVSWHQANQSLHWLYDTRRLAGKPPEYHFCLNHWYDLTTWTTMFKPLVWLDRTWPVTDPGSPLPEVDPSFKALKLVNRDSNLRAAEVNPSCKALKLVYRDNNLRAAEVNPLSWGHQAGKQG